MCAPSRTPCFSARPAHGRGRAARRPSRLARRRAASGPAPARRGPRHALVSRGSDVTRLRRPQDAGGPARRRQADAGAQGRPTRVLRAALPAARRPGHRPAAADAAARRRRGPDPRAPDARLTDPAPVAILLALATAVVYGGADFLGGLAARRVRALLVVG